jgi:hypothetical protein
MLVWPTSASGSTLLDRGMLRRIGLEATTTINRHDFGVSTLDDLARRRHGGEQRHPRKGGRRGDPPGRSGRTGAIAYYR